MDVDTEVATATVSACAHGVPLWVRPSTPWGARDRSLCAVRGGTRSRPPGIPNGFNSNNGRTKKRKTAYAVLHSKTARGVVEQARGRLLELKPFHRLVYCVGIHYTFSYFRRRPTSYTDLTALSVVTETTVFLLRFVD